MNQPFSFTKIEMKPGELARYEVSACAQVIGQVFKFQKDNREVWQYEGSPYQHHLFHSRGEAARKLYARVSRIHAPIF